MFFTFVSIVCSDYLLKLPLVLKMDEYIHDPGDEDLNVFRFLNCVECLLLCPLPFGSQVSLMIFGDPMHGFQSNL